MQERSDALQTRLDQGAVNGAGAEQEHSSHAEAQPTAEATAEADPPVEEGVELQI